jgi:hypothetical protein
MQVDSLAAIAGKGTLVIAPDSGLSKNVSVSAIIISLNDKWLRRTVR